MIFCLIPYKHIASFYGTPANSAEPDQITRRLVRFLTVCLQNVLLRFERNCKLLPNNPEIKNRVILLIRVDIRFIWVNFHSSNMLLSHFKGDVVFAMFCARLFICALWSPAGKGLTSWLLFVVSSVSLSLSHWHPGSGVVLDCIDS